MSRYNMNLPSGSKLKGHVPKTYNEWVEYTRKIHSMPKVPRYYPENDTRVDFTQGDLVNPTLKFI